MLMMVENGGSLQCGCSMLLDGGEDCDCGGEGMCLMEWIVMLEKEGVS